MSGKKRIERAGKRRKQRYRLTVVVGLGVVVGEGVVEGLGVVVGAGVGTGVGVSVGLGPGGGGDGGGGGLRKSVGFSFIFFIDKRWGERKKKRKQSLS